MCAANDADGRDVGFVFGVCGGGGGGGVLR